MTTALTTEILLIRHAPAVTHGMLAGRRDVAADCSDLAALADLRAAVGRFDHLWISPALRCRQTAHALWPDRPAKLDERLWEQNFGAWEGVAFNSLPDLGPQSGAELAAHRPPFGESFADLCERVFPALNDAADLGGSVVIVAHAGPIRAGLAQALGSVPAGLAFQIGPMSLTRIFASGDQRSIAGVNRVFA